MSNAKLHSGLGHVRVGFGHLSRLTTLFPLGIPAFFATKMAVGLAIMELSAKYLTIGDFAVFSQFFVFASLVNLLATGGGQNGLIRQIAAATDDYGARTAVAASIAIWLGVSALIMVTLIMFSAQISTFLTGSPGLGWAVPWIGLTALAQGAGQIYCALLAGRGQLGRSLAVQGLGVILGGGGALALLWFGDAVCSVIAFSAGSSLSVFAAWRYARAFHLPQLERLRDIVGDLRILLAFARTFLAVAAAMPAALFVLRNLYREAAGLEALGYWLMANRISDLSTQMTGIFLSQAFIPRLAATSKDDPAARALIARAALTTFALQGSFLGVFLALPEFIVKTVASEKFLPAIPFIICYMAADTLRCIPAIAQCIAIARCRANVYLFIELAIAALFAAITSSFILLRMDMAPALAYLATYAIYASVGVVIFFTPQLSYLWQRGWRNSGRPA